MAIGAAIAGASGSLISNAVNMINEWQNRGWQSQRDYDLQLRDYDKAISDYFLDKQMNYNTMMSNTAYQRAVADMQAAGLNPASMAGVNAAAASSPAASGVSHGSTRGSARQYYIQDNFMNSAVNAMLAKDSKAADLLASEIIDNARHAHAMEESREQRFMYDEYAKLAQIKRKYKENALYDKILSK